MPYCYLSEKEFYADDEEVAYFGDYECYVQCMESAGWRGPNESEA